MLYYTPVELQSAGSFDRFRPAKGAGTATYGNVASSRTVNAADSLFWNAKVLDVLNRAAPHLPPPAKFGDANSRPSSQYASRPGTSVEVERPKCGHL
jgi:hypothetical protein